MRKVLSVLAAGALAVMLSATPANAAASDRYQVQRLDCHHGLVGRLLDDLLGWV
jgi:hypothetical protein